MMIKGSVKMKYSALSPRRIPSESIAITVLDLTRVRSARLTRGAARRINWIKVALLS
jgi:hypothetical protein